MTTFEEWWATPQAFWRKMAKGEARKIWEAATAAEREACARVCETEKETWNPRWTDEDIALAGKQAADNCAAAIRART